MFGMMIDKMPKTLSEMNRYSVLKNELIQNIRLRANAFGASAGV